MMAGPKRASAIGRLSCRHPAEGGGPLQGQRDTQPLRPGGRIGREHGRDPGANRAGVETEHPDGLGRPEGRQALGVDRGKPHVDGHAQRIGEGGAGQGQAPVAEERPGPGGVPADDVERSHRRRPRARIDQVVLVHAGQVVSGRGARDDQGVPSRLEGQRHRHLPGQPRETGSQDERRQARRRGRRDHLGPGVVMGRVGGISEVERPAHVQGGAALVEEAFHPEGHVVGVIPGCL